MAFMKKREIEREVLDSCSSYGDGGFGRRGQWKGFR
jgi:hypothetical protein